MEIEEHEPAELNRLLEKFYAKGYEPDSLRVMIAVTCQRLGNPLVETGLGGKSAITATGQSW